MYSVKKSASALAVDPELSAPAGAGLAASAPYGAESADSEDRTSSEERTRDRVRIAVLEHGPVTAAELGRRLGFTPAAVRRHLDHLSRAGVIEVKTSGRSRVGTRAGRPARHYVLSQQGQSGLGDDYLDIARTALKRLAELSGPAAVEAFAEERFAAMEERYRPIVEAAGSEVGDRAKALAVALNGDGFVASTTSIGANGSLPAALAAEQLCQGHCPVQQLAAEFPIFCDKETEVFARLVGVDVRRLSTLAGGGHVCTTHIPTGRPVGAQQAVLLQSPAINQVSNHQQERP
ncbi:helix-turn-helix transcriptional regulator [Pseudarthrobacter sp. J1763]|uniref:helix-turn-helix transcriptional regulator n=1 Tax=Pseudarthrobacter sp. J1763 TaxID=3420445 RepID=UPI003D2DA0D0